MDQVAHRPLAAERLRELTLSDSGFVFDPRTGLSFTANDTALECLKLLRDGLDDQEVSRRLSLVFDHPAELIEPAVAAFRRQMARYVQ